MAKANAAKIRQAVKEEHKHPDEKIISASTGRESERF